MPIEWNMGISTLWGGASDDGNRIDWGLYCSLPEHGHTIHCNSSYHVLVSGGKSEDKDAAIAEVMGADLSRYPMDKSGAHIRGDWERVRYGGVIRRDRLGYGRDEGGRTTRETREDQAETWRRSS